MVSDAAATKAPIAKIADKVSGVFVPVVISIALITFIGWLIAGENVGSALSYGIAVLVISCPCALGLATPVAIMVGNGVGAKNGILFKTAASLEAAGKIQIVALDKTGTITAGEPDVTDIIPVAAKDANELLEIAYTLERKSEHPLAKAVLKKAEEFSGARVIRTEPLPLSSTEIREILKKGGDVSNMVPEAVLSYIKRRGLYEKPLPSPEGRL